ncbi:MAG: cyclopropane-fatty-acyl-phospholipid synthase family protein [Alphaproteobacteria bacterium]|nr:cyclopropane-fatty-acyl-phospholipid synthase family protein [Alphaproteobacteria bacterium]
MAGLDKHYEPYAKQARHRENRDTGRTSRPIVLLLFRALAPIIGAFAKRGSLHLNYRGQVEVSFGDGTGPKHQVRLNNLKTVFRIMKNPELGCGESYMDQGWVLERGDLGSFLRMMCRNETVAKTSIPGKTMRAVSDILFRNRRNTPRKSRKNVAHHYDIGNDLYEAFLDEGMNYSCAFFAQPDQPLRNAQLNKLHTTIDRLQIPEGSSVLDIGSGWGELTRLIASETGARHVTGVTLATTQRDLARERAAELTGNRPEYLLVDYRVHAAQNPAAYDRIVSVGMFEHVGVNHFVEYFDAIRDMLTDDGQALVHSIMRPKRNETSPWFQKYIFPGGYIPTLEDTLAAAREAGLELAHEPFIHESFHYAETLRRWRRNFNAAWPTLESPRYDQRFRRMWNFYLAGSEAGFDENALYVGQILLKKKN